MRRKKSLLIVFALIISMFFQMIPLAFADAPKYPKVLKIVSGSQKNLATFTYNDQVVSKGFAVSISMMAAVEPNEESLSKVAFAVPMFYCNRLCLSRRALIERAEGG
jgi:cytochrome c oxidase assembly protein Cox11